MKKRLQRSIVAAALTLACGNAVSATAQQSAMGKKAPPPSTITGITSSQSPYVVPLAEGVITKSLLTVGDAVNNNPNGAPYRMVGIPDGLGAYNNGDGTFTVLMNHELGAGIGAVRAHGATGAFISKWTLRKNDLAVLRGEDLIQNIALYNTTNCAYEAPAKGVELRRLCSANLPPMTAFYDKKSKLGFKGTFFMNGEETGAEGRAFAHGLDGTSYELPYLGKFSWENSLAHPGAGSKTIVAGTDDATTGQIYFYVGEKRASGNAVERAGLSGGLLYGVKVNGVVMEERETGIASGTRFSLASMGDVSRLSGAELQAKSDAAGVTTFLRPEDGNWSTQKPNDFYFVTTDRFDTFKNPGTPPNQVGRSRLWRLRFDDIKNPEAGGVIEMLLDGTESQEMMDNLTIDNKARVALIQEDPGNQPYLAKILQYNGAADNLGSAQRLTTIAQHDPNRFMPGAPNFLTQDEESSGIIDISDIVGLDGTFLFDVQAHYPTDSELVEGGQLVAMYVPPLKENGDARRPRYKKPFPKRNAR